jgi:hypothetical protein
MLTVQRTAPPPPEPDLLHCCTVVTGSVKVVTVVSLVTESIEPTHRIMVRVEGGNAASPPPAAM